MKRAMISVVSVLAIGLAGLLPACNSQDAHNLQEDTKKLAKDTGEALGTATLAAKIRTHLSLHKGVDQSGISIDVSKDDVVTVSGKVRTKQEHDRVLNIVKETPGVDKWSDKLEVAK